MIARFFFFPVLWLILITVALLTPGQSLPDAGMELPHFDKTIHFLLFAVLSFLLAQALKKQFTYTKLRYNALIYAFIVSFSYGVLMEIMQHLFFSGRYFEWMDIFANFMGCLAGLFIFKIVFRKI